MKHNYKFFLASITMLVLHVTMAMGATVTYSLTTHVDGRTITGNANVNTMEDVLDKMPQALWRAYCTYKFYSDEELTQEITTVPASGSTVYVDYVFDPPFILSEEGKDPVWHYLRTYNSGGIKNYIVYYKQSENRLRAWHSQNGSTPSYGSNNAMDKAGHDQWAFYGDGYAFQIKLNDASLSNPWVRWNSTSASESFVSVGAKPTVGWQLYVNTATNSKLPNGGTMAMGPYDTTNYLAELENVSNFVWTDGLDTSRKFFDSHNQLVSKTGTNQDQTLQKQLWWNAFFATPTDGSPSTTDIWHTTYKIKLSDGTWYPDIVVRKMSNDASTLQLTFPSTEKFSRQANPKYAYKYFFIDNTFISKFESTQLTNDGNTIAYILEIEVPTEELVSGKWITLVLPYNIDNISSTQDFGDGAVVKVLEYYELENTQGTYYTLKFKESNKIEANKPYLFKPVSVPEGGVMPLQKTEDPVEQNAIDNAIGFVGAASNAKVWMTGTYEGKELKVQEAETDPLYFYFGYDSRYDNTSGDYVGDENSVGKYPYNFYRVTKKNVTMPKHRCYFHIENPPAGAKLMLVDNFGEEITSIDGIDASEFIQIGGIYNLNGQMVGTNLQALPRGVYIVNGKKVMK